MCQMILINIVSGIIQERIMNFTTVYRVHSEDPLNLFIYTPYHSKFVYLYSFSLQEMGIF